MNWEIIVSMAVSVVGALGGVEFIKWWYNRDEEREKAELAAEKAEISALRDTIETLREAIRLKHDNNEWLQQQMQAKEERFVEQTQLVRKLNSEVLDLTQKLANETFAHKFDECQDRKCPFREPPKPYTPARSGHNKEEYFNSNERELAPTSPPPTFGTDALKADEEKCIEELYTTNKKNETHA